MSDFTQAVKYLDIVKARELTQAEINEFDNKGWPQSLSKYQMYVPARTIQKINQVITIPALNITNGVVQSDVPYLVGQYNFSVENSFFIKKMSTSTTTTGTITDPYLYAPKIDMPSTCMVIKWRVGTTVYRYLLNRELELVGPAHLGPVTLLLDYLRKYRIVDGVLYNPLQVLNKGVQVLPNFCVEYWTCGDGLGSGPNAYVPGNKRDFLIQASTLVNPSNPDETQQNEGASSFVPYTNLTHALPEALPTSYGEASAWLDNT